MNVVASLRTVALAIAWLALAALIALGAAGIVASMNHIPGTDGRPELTWTDDQAARPALDAATDQLQALSDGVDAAGDDGAGRPRRRSTPATSSALSTAIATGTGQIGRSRVRPPARRRRSGRLPVRGDNPELALSPERDRTGTRRWRDPRA